MATGLSALTYVSRGHTPSQKEKRQRPTVKDAAVQILRLFLEKIWWLAAAVAVVMIAIAAVRARRPAAAAAI